MAVTIRRPQGSSPTPKEKARLQLLLLCTTVKDKHVNKFSETRVLAQRDSTARNRAILTNAGGEGEFVGSVENFECDDSGRIGMGPHEGDAARCRNVHIWLTCFILSKIALV